METSPEQHPNRMFADFYISLISGAVAGACAKTTIAPLDRVKINFQTSVHMPFTVKNAVNYMVKQVHSEGFFSLWRGNSATMVRIVPYAAIQFTAHEQFKRLLGIGKNPLRSPKWKRFLAGSLAGVTASSLTYPLDVARARMAVTPRSYYSSLFDVFRAMRNDGIRKGFYRGLTPTLIGSACYGGSSFFTYETLKNHYMEWLERAAEVKNSTSTSNDSVARKMYPHERLGCGAVAGIIGQSCSYPLDIVRRRMQTSTEIPFKPKSISRTTKHAAGSLFRRRDFFLWTALVHIAREEGVKKGLYKGLSLNWIKGPTAVGISFTVYDHLSDWLRSVEKRVEDVIAHRHHPYWPTTAIVASVTSRVPPNVPS